MSILKTNFAKTFFKVAGKCTLICLPGLVLAVILYLATNKISKPFSTPAYCGSECHEMDTAYKSWELSIHNTNSSGLVAECIDCHLPDKDNFIVHMSAKISVGVKDLIKHHFGDEYDVQKNRQKVLDSMPNERCLACHANLLGKAVSLEAKTAHSKDLDPSGKNKSKCVECHNNMHVRDEATLQLLADGTAKYKLDFETGPDAVTQATPGYPKNKNVPPNLREEIPHGPFMTPFRVENLALGKTVTSSMEEEPIIGELAQITDGIKKSDEFDYVELDPGPQWVQIDLGQTHTIFAVGVWHYYKNPVIYNDVIVQVADNSDFAGNVKTLFNNDYDNSAGQDIGQDTSYYSRWWGEIVDARGPDNNGTKTRYVRIYTNGGAAEEETRFVEIAVYGK